MSLKAAHPRFDEMIPMWKKMRDFYSGQDVVKSAGELYLPPTSGMILDGMGPGQKGRMSYDAYKTRAVVPDYVKEGTEALIGLLHQKPAQIKVPKSMEYLLNSATVDGENMAMFHRRINEEQLVSGRLGILCDLPKIPDPSNPRIYMTLYVAETIRNWDDSSGEPGKNELNLVVLDESAPKREGFSWTQKELYRVLQLGNLIPNEETAPYVQGVFEGDNYDESKMVPPLFRGTALNKIPFVFVNTKDLITDPDKSPLKGLADLCHTIYCMEADYRQNLHMQGQDTLVTVGGVRNPDGVPGEEDAIRVGAGSRIDVDIGGDAKYIGTSAAGLSEQRQCIEADRQMAESRAGHLVGNQSIKNESGNAMLARLAAQTANLNQIALASAAGLERALKFIAEWIGEDPNSVTVVPNLEFTKMAETAQEFVYLMTARKEGAPLSLESIHSTLKNRGYTKLDFEEEMKLVKKEGPNGAPEPNKITSSLSKDPTADKMP